jgi:hypothetical protein
MTTTLYKGTVMDLDDPLVPPHILRDIENELVHKTGTIVEIVPAVVPELSVEEAEDTVDDTVDDAVDVNEESDESVEDAEKVSPMRRRKQSKK